MDFLYIIVVVALWASEFLVAKYIYDRFEEKKSGEKNRKTPEWSNRRLRG